MRVDRRLFVGAVGLVSGGVHLAHAAGHGTHEGGTSALFVLDGVALALLGVLALAGSVTALRAAAAVCGATAVAFVAVHTGIAPLAAHPADALAVAVTLAEVAAAGVVFVRRAPSRRSVALVALVVAVLPGLPAARAFAGDASTPTGCVEPNRRMTLYAEELPSANGHPRVAYGLTPGTASIPGPLIEMIEGECLAITLVNHVRAETLRDLRERYGGAPDLPLGISLHVHGVKYLPLGDGTVHTGSYVPPGQARTYVWYAAPRVSVAGRVVSLGTAGTWWYHDHVSGTDHGTGGLASGLFGGFVVRRPGDPIPDRTYTVVLGHDTSINLRRWPDTFSCDEPQPAAETCFFAHVGERVEFVVVGVGDEFHTFHLHGHNWAATRTGMLASQADEAALIDARTIGPSESFGFQIIAGEEVGPGDWMLHCHVQTHSDLGMATFFRVAPPGTPVQVPQLGGHGHAHGSH